jgi:hypothetical protein
MTEQAQAQPQPQEQTELKTIQIGETLYDVSTVTEQGVNIINDVRSIDNILSQQQLTVSITQLAKSKMIEELEKEAVKFTAIKQEPPIPTAS